MLQAGWDQDTGKTDLFFPCAGPDIKVSKLGVSVGNEVDESSWENFSVVALSLWNLLPPEFKLVLLFFALEKD